MRPVTMALLGTALLTTSALAQSSGGDAHSGFHAAVGLGWGSVGVSCDGCSTDRSNSLALVLRAGGAIRPGVVLSGELTGWSKQQNGATATALWETAVVQWYPRPTGGFYVKGGAGVAELAVAINGGSTGNAELRTVNPGLEVGAGFDMRLSRGISLTPYADFLYAARADAKLNGSSTGVNVGDNMLHLGLAVSWR